MPYVKGDPHVEAGETLGSAIRKARKAETLTQKRLAEIIHVNPDTISGWENNNHKPRPAEMTELKRLLPTLAGLLENVPISPSAGVPAREERRTREGVVGRVIHKAIAHLLALDEHHGNDSRRTWIIGWLRDTAKGFSKHGADVSEILEAAEQLEANLKRS